MKKTSESSKSSGSVVYDEYQYWSKKEKPSVASIKTTQQHIDFIKNSIGQHKYVLDFGPGDGGKVLSAFDSVKKLELYDISASFKEKLFSALNQKPYLYNMTIENTIKNLPYNNNQFDLVVAASVLLHQRPVNIVNIMKELARVSKHEVAIITYTEFKKAFVDHHDFSYVLHVEKNANSFNYDYQKICQENDFNITYWNFDQRTTQLYLRYTKGS